MDTQQATALSRREELSIEPAATSPALVYLARLTSPASRRTMAGHLDRIAAMVAAGRGAGALPWAALRYEHTQAIRSALAGGQLAPATANTALAALRGVLREAWRLGQMSAEEYRRAADLAPIRAETLPAGRALAADELAALLRACDDGPSDAPSDAPAGGDCERTRKALPAALPAAASRCDSQCGAAAKRERSARSSRDRAIVSVLYGCGLRRSELVGLDVGDWDAREGSLRVRRGKGGKQRLAYLGEPAALVDWVRAAELLDGALFRAISRGGRVLERRLSAAGVYAILQQRAAAAGVRDVSPHDMRRSHISDLLDAGVDLATVAKMVGHSQVQTTSRYDRRGDAAKRAAAGRLRIGT